MSLTDFERNTLFLEGFEAAKEGQSKAEAPKDREKRSEWISGWKRYFEIHPKEVIK